MGTRADFYVANEFGQNLDWIGSIAWDGYPEGIDEPVLAAKTEQEFRAAVADFFADRDDVTLPAQGWPWPWDTSGTTDFGYVLIEGRGVFHRCNHTVEETVAVIQADRDAAATLALQTSATTEEQWEAVQAINSGNADESPLVQAFARHRLASHAGEDVEWAIKAVAEIEMEREGHPLSRTQEEIYGDAAETVDAVLAALSLPPSTHDELEALGEALLRLSDHLRRLDTLSDDAAHAAYEKVVAAFQALTKMGEKL